VEQAFVKSDSAQMLILYIVSQEDTPVEVNLLSPLLGCPKSCFACHKPTVC